MPAASAPTAPTAQDIAAAQARIAPWLLRTPVVESRELGLPFAVELKLEQMQLSGSFKARGAFNSLLSLPLPEAGVVAASGGNHGAAVAAAAARLGVQARIFVPEIAGPAKIALIEAQGAALEVVPGFYPDAFARAEAWRDRTGALMIHANGRMKTDLVFAALLVLSLMTVVFARLVALAVARIWRRYGA